MSTTPSESSCARTMTLDDRIERYLAATPPAIAGQGGDTLTYKVACSLVNGFALPPEQALHWLRVYSTKCDPPWSESELLHKVESALVANHRKPVVIFSAMATACHHAARVGRHLRPPASCPPAVAATR